MIKIVSGWSNPGGSTVANINLCNLFNQNDMPCTFYGPHEWHMDKCKGDSHQNLKLERDDTVITHYCLVKNVGFKKLILSCHETNLFELKTIDQAVLDTYDVIHYVSNTQRAYHSLNKAFRIIPNVITKLEHRDIYEDESHSAGIIGSIDPHKQTHLSIERAIKDGWKHIKLYGAITDPNYFTTSVKPLVRDNKDIKIEVLGVEDNIQKIYDSIEAVYHSSKRETFNMIKEECRVSGVEYYGLESAESKACVWDDEDILTAWNGILQ